MKNIINWKMFTILLVMSLISIVCVFPYVLTIQGDVIKKIGLPINIIFIAQFIQSGILFSILIFLGLILTKKINFQLPLLEAILNKGNYKIVLKDIWGMSVILWIITAIAIYVTDIWFTLLGAAITTHNNYAPIWQKLLASVYWWITEEIIMRLFLMALFIWIGMKIFKQNKPTNINVIISIILAAIIFWLWHLPITASLVTINSLVITRAIVLNGIGGIVFWWLFWKKWIESSMIAHFTADIFLITILPLIFK